MKASTLIKILAVAAANAIATDQIPQQLRKEAQQTFSEGKPYFIWTTNAQPVIGKEAVGLGWMATAAVIDVQIVAHTPTNGPLFRLRTELDTIDPKGERPNTHTSIFPDESAPGFACEPPDFSYVAPAWIIATNATMKGSGSARIRLVPADSKKAGTNALSNVLQVRVQFKNAE